MKKNKILLYGIPLLFLPFYTIAQSRNVPISNDGFAFASVFAGDLSLLLSVVIGIMATFYVFRSASKMGGGLFGSILNYIGVGMVFIVLGTVSMIVEAWFVTIWFNIANTIFFAFGYIFMVIGANKLLRGIMSN